MKLLELLEIIEESQSVVISDADNNQLCIYDGRDNVPTEYNDKDIIQIYADIYKSTLTGWNFPALRVQINHILTPS